jgi:hypothetical protein
LALIFVKHQIARVKQDPQDFAERTMLLQHGRAEKPEIALLVPFVGQTPSISDLPQFRI